MMFKDFSEFLQVIEKENSRNEITVKIANFFEKISPEEAKLAMYLFQGRLVPKYVDLEFNFSRKLLLKALSLKFDSSLGSNFSKELFTKLGDVGLVTEQIIEASKNQPKIEMFTNEKKELLISEVYEYLEKIAMSDGKGSQTEKQNIFLELISNLDALSARYASRIIVGELRLGVSDKTILDSLSWYVKGNKSLRKDLDSAFGAKADIGELTETVLSTSKDKIEEVISKIEIKPLIPIASKLVEREVTPTKVWERMPNCFVQPKLDGLRGQIHRNEKGEVEIYSRNMENMTDQFPELTESVLNLNVESIVLDSEIIGINTQTNEYLTYQETMQRKRKYDIESYSSDLPVVAMCFDVLYLNGEDLTKTPIEKRIQILKDLIYKSDSSLRMLETKQIHSEEELTDYFEEKVKYGLEGIITKEAGSDYEPGTRNYKWIKLKANSKRELVDTIDVAVLGYYSGRGQRAKFGVGALLAGVYDPETDKYYSIGKIGTGISDELFETIFKDLSKIVLTEKPKNYEVQNQLNADVWVDPKIIIEIDADEITRSPAHTAGIGIKANVAKDDETRGLSIRFPRLKIWNREDKDLPNTVEEILRMYELRKGK